MGIKLVLPHKKYEVSYKDALSEAKAENQETRLQELSPNQTFAEFIQSLENESKGINLQAGHVPTTTWWLVDGDQFIGRIKIRHLLNDFFMKYGGQIGYYIRPSKRKQGYGYKILKLGLIKAYKLGFSKVLITCDDDNVASQKIIELNGGKLENIIDNPGHQPKRRYWITIQAKC